MTNKTIKAQIKLAPAKVHAGNLTDYIIRYECGDCSDDDFIALFQYLIDSGLAWTLQGRYGRTASALIKAGQCHK